MSPENSKQTCIEIEFANLPLDSSLRRKFFYYCPKDIDQVWRTYLQCGPYQLVDHTCPQREFEKIKCWSNSTWFNDYKDQIFYYFLLMLSP